MRSLSLILCIAVWFVFPIIGIALANVYMNPVWKLVGILPLIVTVAITIAICTFVPSCIKFFNLVYRIVR